MLSLNTFLALWHCLLVSFYLSDTSFFPSKSKHLNLSQVYKQSKSSTSHFHTHSRNTHVSSSSFLPVLNWHKFLSWQRPDDFLCLTPWKCLRVDGRPHLSPFFPHYPVLWSLLLKEKNNYNTTQKPKHACDTESSDAFILKAPSALSCLLFVLLHSCNLWWRGWQLTMCSVYLIIKYKLSR